MEVDEPFAEYVAARWSMLYRLAVLLVGETGADDLAQAALVAAYLSWGDVREAPSADDHLKQVLARTAARLPERPRPDLVDPHADPVVDTGVDPVVDTDVDPDPDRGAHDGRDERPPDPRERLWARLEELPPRRRAMVVLRDYEALSDTEVGAVLGCSAAVVTAELSEWDAHVDRAALREELFARADRADVPLPPTEALVARGHVLRRRRTGRRVRWTIFAALLVVTGLALASVVQGATRSRSATPRPERLPALPLSLAELPDGRSPRIGYSEGSVLHLGDGREVTLAEVPTALATTRSGIYAALPTGRIVRVDFDTGTGETVTDSAAGQLVSDSGGTHVAWLTTAAGKAWVTVGSVGPAGGALLGRQQQVPTATCCYDSVVLNGMTGSGRLIVSNVEQGVAYSWDTGRSPAPGDGALFRDLTGLGNGVVSQVTGREVVGQYGASHFAAGELRDGTFLVSYELNARQADFADPLGDRVVYLDQAGETHVLERRTHGHPRTPENVRLQIPLLREGWKGVRWEDADHVLVDVRDDSAPNGALVRCDVHTGGCAVATRLTGAHLLAG